ncbi:bacteriocin/colicin V production protein [Neoasaia chiangmaiensis NBRC 101099]|uniref:Uncharacterized protein n=1 Tax=Neoasaia chiangmaiensis TaxID=320497 RepID=A0A1U9KSV1_9PROT|nr:CvpA family protein [Neoasaia chiangmaiensis]AQS88924.1 hypothetical protein A0U93_14475 [Neoasaia chiangmaiensis]GBR40393.1 bacteriocin/colicin V production protein [Neoasaia chiangmaiensis NBRC 101099]GEN13921.1 hypothetical protein NCH01_03520 [Neoasaia chiangmaiensis]
MTTADIVALTTMGLAALWGMFNGFWTLVLGFAAWAGAIWVTVECYALLLPFIAPHVGDVVVAKGLAMASCFVVSILIFSSIARRAGRLVQGSVLGSVDRLLGIGLGAAVGFGFLVIGFVALHAFFGRGIVFIVHGSHLAPYIERSASYLEGLLPSFAQTGVAPLSAPGHDAAI